jgi:hypothetical protein
VAFQLEIRDLTAARQHAVDRAPKGFPKEHPAMDLLLCRLEMRRPLFGFELTTLGKCRKNKVTNGTIPSFSIDKRQTKMHRKRLWVRCYPHKHWVS